MSHMKQYKTTTILWVWQAFARALKTGCFVLYCCCLSTSVYAVTIQGRQNRNGGSLFSCHADASELKGVKCRESCKENHKGVGPLCWKRNKNEVKTDWICEKGKRVKSCPTGYSRKRKCSCTNEWYSRTTKKPVEMLDKQHVEARATVRCFADGCKRVKNGQTDDFIERYGSNTKKGIGNTCPSCQYCEVQVPETKWWKRQHIEWTCTFVK